MKKNICFIIIFTLGTTVYSQSRKIENLKKDYIECALQNFDDKTLPIIKWENKDTLKYHINGTFRFMSKRNWERFLNEIEILSNIKIVESKNIHESDINIFFGELYDYFDLYNINVSRNLISSNFDNWHNRNYNSNKQLTNTSYCISSKTKDSRRGVYNLQKLFLKSMGLIGELENDTSLFNKQNTDANTHLQKDDKRIIRIHYDNSIKAGMTTPEVTKVLDTFDLQTILDTKY